MYRRYETDLEKEFVQKRTLQVGKARLLYHTMVFLFNCYNLAITSHNGNTE